MRFSKITLAGAATVAALALSAAGMSGASASVKPAATPACGTNCQDYSSLLLANDGDNSILNAFVSGDTGRVPTRPVDVNFNMASNGHPNEDWGYQVIGTVGQFCQNGFNTGGILAENSVACTTYRNFPAFELNWQPFGVESGLCAGTSGPVTAGQNVKLELCGKYQGSIFVLDTGLGVRSASGQQYEPAIDGADTGFSHPFVLTLDAGTKSPINQLKIDSLNTAAGVNVAPDDQEFTAVNGPAA